MARLGHGLARLVALYCSRFGCRNAKWQVTNIDDGKIGLSMKLVSQNDGTDLDPLNGVP